MLYWAKEAAKDYCIILCCKRLLYNSMQSNRHIFRDRKIMGFQRSRLVRGTACKETETTFWVGNVLSIDYDGFYIVWVFSKTHWTVYLGCRKFITWKLYLIKVVRKLSIKKNGFWSLNTWIHFYANTSYYANCSLWNQYLIYKFQMIFTSPFWGRNN